MRKWLGFTCLLLLTGCASAPSSNFVVDEAYVAKVNWGARMGGAQVYWVQMPTIPKTVGTANNT